MMSIFFYLNSVFTYSIPLRGTFQKFLYFFILCGVERAMKCNGGVFIQITEDSETYVHHIVKCVFI